MKFFIALNLALLFYSASAIGQARDSDGEKSHPLEIFITHSYWLPFEYEQDGISTGITVDIVNAILSEMGFVVKFKQMPFKRAVEEAKMGNADAVMSIVKTAERQEYFFFPSEPSVIWGLYLYFPKDKVVPFKKDLQALEGLRIGTARGFTYPDNFMNSELIQRKVANEDLVNLKKTKVGRLDAFVCDNINCQLLINENQMEGMFHMYKETPLSLDEVFLAFSKKSTAISQYPNLHKKFSETLTRLKQEGVIADIKSKYGITN